MINALIDENGMHRLDITREDAKKELEEMKDA